MAFAELVKEISMDMKDITGYEGYYSITSTGMVLRKARISVSRHGTPLKLKEKWFSLLTNYKGYKEVHLTKDGIKKIFKVHRLVALAFLTKPSDINKDCINHLNGKKDDNRVENLEWVSNKENSVHSWQIGLHLNYAKGERIALSKLNERKVLFIRENSHIKSSILARKFGVHRTAIYKIKARETWKHI